MKIKLTRDAKVTLPGGTVVEVSAEQARILFKLGFAVEVTEKKPTRKKD